MKIKGVGDEGAIFSEVIQIILKEGLQDFGPKRILEIDHGGLWRNSIFQRIRLNEENLTIARLCKVELGLLAQKATKRE